MNLSICKSENNLESNTYNTGLCYIVTWWLSNETMLYTCWKISHVYMLVQNGKMFLPWTEFLTLFDLGGQICPHRLWLRLNIIDSMQLNFLLLTFQICSLFQISLFKGLLILTNSHEFQWAVFDSFYFPLAQSKTKIKNVWNICCNISTEILRVQKFDNFLEISTCEKEEGRVGRQSGGLWYHLITYSSNSKKLETHFLKWNFLWIVK